MQPNWELGTSELLAYSSKLSEGGYSQESHFLFILLTVMKTTHIVGVILPPEP